MTTHVQIHQVDDLIAIETISPGLTSGHSILIPAGEAASLVVELLAISSVFRAYQSMRDPAASSHQAKRQP